LKKKAKHCGMTCRAALDFGPGTTEGAVEGN